MLIADDVDILKHGHKSVGVALQYAGSIGKIESCQVGVDLVAAVPGLAWNADQLTWPLGLELYLPRLWLENEEFEGLRQQCDVPDEIPFQTKPEIALDLLARAREASVCVGADAGYGDDRSFRTHLRKWSEPYIVGVTPSELRIVPGSTPIEEPGRRSGRSTADTSSVPQRGHSDGSSGT